MMRNGTQTIMEAVNVLRVNALRASLEDAERQFLDRLSRQLSLVAQGNIKSAMETT